MTDRHEFHLLDDFDVLREYGHLVEMSTYLNSIYVDTNRLNHAGFEKEVAQFRDEVQNATRRLKSLINLGISHTLNEMQDRGMVQF